MKDLYVKRPNDLVEARFTLTGNQNDIIDLLLLKIDKDDKKLEYEIVINDYNDLFIKSKKHVYDDLKKATKLFKKNAGFTVYNYNGQAEQDFFWFTNIIYKDSEGKIIYKITNDLKEILLQMKNVTFYNIKYPINLTSIYSKRMYYYLKRFEDTGYRIDYIDDLRTKLNCPESYKKYTFFKINVIDKSIQEINKECDIKIKYDEIKENRKVIKIKFYISTKNKKNNKKNNQNELNRKLELTQKEKENKVDIDDLLDELRNIILEPLKIKDLKAILGAAKNDLEVVKNKYELSKNQDIDNLAAWLIKAIEEDYQEPVKTAKKQTRKPKKQPNAFNNFPQREYTSAEMEELEKKLLEKSMKNV